MRTTAGLFEHVATRPAFLAIDASWLPLLSADNGRRMCTDSSIDFGLEK